MDLKDILRAACLSAILLGAGGATHAGTAWTGTRAIAATQEDNDTNQSVGGTASSSSEFARDWGTGFAQGRAHAIAGDGYVKAYGEGSGSGHTDDGRSEGSGGATAMFKDMLTFSSVAHAGMLGQVTIQAVFDAQLQTFGDATATSEFGLSVGLNGLQFRQTQTGDLPLVSALAVSDAFGYRELPYDRVATITIDITWGDTLPLSMQLSALGRTYNAWGTFSGAAADAFHSGYWGGIVSATAGGVAINDFSVLSSTGVDFRDSFAPVAAVPEPESVALLAMGLLAVWTRVRRADRRNRVA